MTIQVAPNLRTSRLSLEKVLWEHIHRKDRYHEGRIFKRSYRDSSVAIREIKLAVGSVAGAEALMKTYPHDDTKNYLMPTYKLTAEGTDDGGKPSTKEFTVIRYGIKCEQSGGRVYVVGLSDDQKYTISEWLPAYMPDTSEPGAWRVKDNYLVHDGPDDIATGRFGAVGCIELCGVAQFDAFNDYLISLSGSSATTRNEKLKEIAAAGKMTIHYLKATPPPLKEQQPTPRQPHPCERIARVD